ncbi:GrpB family protein [Neobacillus sp. OS1-2]|uniref:GrpB family protein n=1 Tax=Neobacillus sp. OS1-2 TaxID=3070680 RepID=UPI0027E00AED|nr:GrpB family protein [Neobacillus sp. OS1-2]WML39520.1 GrpB family protein [Neobacillus sp. OS1-2]
MVRTVIIEDYNSDWTKDFEREKSELINILNGKIISIEHIGSTSVNGLGAKPILDIAVGVNNLEDVDKFIEPLKQIGYECRQHKEFPERRFFRKGEWRAGTHHLHFYEFESEHWNNQLLFRNYLRTHPDDLKKYHQLKKEMAEKYHFDRVSYTEAKGPFILNILKKAQKEIE